MYQGGTSIVNGASILPGAANVCTSLTGGVGLEIFVSAGLVVLHPARTAAVINVSANDFFILPSPVSVF
jgi:hypothetical protein